jgi:hypothetical protein
MICKTDSGFTVFLFDSDSLIYRQSINRIALQNGMADTVAETIYRNKSPQNGKISPVYTNTYTSNVSSKDLDPRLL